MSIQTAWLITWCNSNARDIEIKAILNGNIEVEKVKWFLEEMYLAETASGEEKLDAALRNRMAYSATVEETENGKISVNCGHNPWLVARLVKRPQFQPSDDREAKVLVWEELD